MEPRRITILDSLRGLASLSVVVHHCLISFSAFDLAAPHAFQANGWLFTLITYTPLHLLWAGHEAVVLFFVLSGFVLALPYLDRRESPYVPYVIKRFCRIYLPYLVAVGLSFAALTVIGAADANSHGVSQLSGWFNAMWGQPVTAPGTVDMVLMLGQFNHQYLTSTWSLVHEMRVSVVFPLIGILARNGEWRVLAVVAAVVSIVGSIAPRIPALGVPVTLGNTLYYTGFFIFGATVAKYRRSLTDFLRQLGPGWTVSLTAGAVVAYVWSWVTPGWPVVSWVITRDWIVGLGATVLLLLCLSSKRITASLSRPSLVWLGQRSYSLYLVHPLVLLLMVYSLRAFLSIQLVIALVVPVSLIVADVCYRIIEAPSIRLGYGLATRFQKLEDVTRASGSH